MNALSVLHLGEATFGHPSRVTARVRLGSGKVVDILREVEMGGPNHTKGVLILGGFLAGRFLPDLPLSLSASLVLEQSYGGVDGDSASSAELYALLSALAEVPIRQSLRRDRLREPARRGAGDRRRQREDRRLLRPLRPPGPDGRTGRPDPEVERSPPDAPEGRRGSGRGGTIPDLSRRDDQRGNRTSHGAPRRGARARRPVPGGERQWTGRGAAPRLRESRACVGPAGGDAKEET